MAKIKFALLDVDGVILRHKSCWQLIHSKLGTTRIAQVHRKIAVEYRAITYRDWALVDVFLWRGAGKDSIRVRESELTPGAIDLLKLLWRKGVYIIVISGGLELVYELIRDYVDLYVSNRLVYRNGKVWSVEVRVSTKEDVIKFLEKALPIDWNKCLAIGDSVIDVPMLMRARYSIAFNPADDEVTKVAKIVVYSQDMGPVIELLERLLS